MGNKIIIFGIIILTSCEKSPISEKQIEKNIDDAIINPHVVHKSEVKFNKLSFLFNQENISWVWQLKVNSGYLMIGSEYNIIAPGLVPDVVYNLERMGIETIQIAIDFDDELEGSKLNYIISFFDIDGNVRHVHKFSRNWSAKEFTSQPEDKLREDDGIYKLTFGTIGNDRILLEPTVYFSKDINILKDRVIISNSIPLWDWALTDLDHLPK